jgi:hypothetical protein
MRIILFYIILIIGKTQIQENLRPAPLVDIKSDIERDEVEF